MTRQICIRAGFVSIDGVATGVHFTRHQEAVVRAVFSQKHTATKEFILTSVYAGTDEPELKIIDVVICNIRRKLGEHRDAIKTVWGRGYIHNEAYCLEPQGNQVVLNVDASLIEEVAFAADQTPDELVARLLNAERARLWLEAA